MDSSDGVSAIVRAALADALSLLLPIACAGCDAPDVALCEDCVAALSPAVEHRRAGDWSGVATWSGLRFEGVAARTMRALKEDGRTGLARALGPALAAAAAAATQDPNMLFVPVPTSRAAFRRRGYNVTELVARRAGIPVSRLLSHTRRTADQRGLDQLERRRNVAGSLRARDAAGRRVMILDDVVTTGATLDEAARALRDAGADVIGAVTISATPRRRVLGQGQMDASQTHR